MALTKAEMRNKILRQLAILPESQVPRASEATIVEDAIDQAQAYLEADGLAYWETTAIPDGVAFGFAAFVAGRVAAELMEAERAAGYARLTEIGLREIRRFCAVGNASFKAEYF